MTGRCDRCGVPSSELVGATMMKESGGGEIHVCKDCREALEAGRCRSCGDPLETDAAPFIYFKPEDDLRICKECRDTIRFSGVIAE